MSRHARRRAKAMEHKGPAVFTQTMLPSSELTHMMCAWADCEAHFKFSDGKPDGWTNLIVYQGATKLNFLDIAPKDSLRDGCLCPEHTQALESQLKELGRALNQPAAGTA